MLKNIALLFLLTYCFIIMYVYIITQRAKALYWAQWMQHLIVNLLCWFLGLIAAVAALTFAIKTWGYLNGLAFVTLLALPLLFIIKRMNFIFPLLVMFAVVSGLTGIITVLFFQAI